MKKIVFIALAFIAVTTHKANAQTYVIDPATISVLTVNHIMQQQVLNDIEDDEKSIRDYQLLIGVEMTRIQNLQEKVHDYLSTVNSVVRNGKDIIYASAIARDIYNYQDKAYEYARGDAKLLAVAAKTEYDLASRSADLMLYIYQFALVGGDHNLLDNKQRMDFCAHVVSELRKMRSISYKVCRQIRFARREGVLKALVPGQFRYVNNGKRKVEEILRNVKYIQNGGHY